MPIASGANNWPKTFWSRAPKRPGVHTNVVVVDRPQDESAPASRPSSARVSYRTPPPSPPPVAPPRPKTEITRVIVDEDRPPSPRIVEVRRTPPPPISKVTHVVEQPPPRTLSPRSTTRYAYGPHDDSMRYDMYNNGHNFNRFGYREAYSAYGYDESRVCCGNHLFGSGRAGGSTGCCQGGLRSNRRYPYGGADDVYLPGDGRHRCCAIITGLIAGLLLLGLLIGLLAGLMPALQKKKAQSNFSSQYPGGRMIDGIYYYPVANPADQFYYWMGPGIPCIMSTVAPGPGTTLPLCNSITTSYVGASGVSLSTTTISWDRQFPGSSDGHRVMAAVGSWRLLLSVATATAFLACARWS